MTPLAGRATREANEQFVVGAAYRLVVEAERSEVSHNHQFAWLKEAFDQLPEDLMERFPTSEHLRKHALIATGYRTERTFVCASKAEALRLAAWLRPINEFAVIVPRDNVVIEWTAESQKRRAMGGQRFNESKQAILDHIAKMIGISSVELMRNAGKAA